jgi:hypothetical protein
LSAIDKNKICFSCNVIVKILPTLNSYELISLIHKKNDQDYVLLDDKSGEMICAGKVLYNQILKTSVDVVHLNKVNFQIFSP